jgi:hypothetical protein
LDGADERTGLARNGGLIGGRPFSRAGISGSNPVCPGAVVGEKAAQFSHGEFHADWCWAMLKRMAG